MIGQVIHCCRCSVNRSQQACCSDTHADSKGNTQGLVSFVSLTNIVQQLVAYALDTVKIRE